MTILNKEYFEDWKIRRSMSSNFMRYSKHVELAEAIEVISEALEQISESDEIAQHIAKDALEKVWGNDADS
jgi:hypothetical protein